MPRPRIEAFWEEAICTLAENDRQLGPLGIRSRLEQAAADMGKADVLRVPSLRTIGRIQGEWRQKPEEKRQLYREFHWPESMELGALPWEAGPAALELLRAFKQWGVGRPSIGIARWFWHVTAIAPDARFDDRFHAAALLNAAHMESPAAVFEDAGCAVELWLAFTPWRSETDAEAYLAALGDVPALPWGLTHRSLRDGPVGPLQRLSADEAKRLVGLIRIPRGDKEGGSQ